VGHDGVVRSGAWSAEVDEGAVAASEGCGLVAEPDVGDDDRHVRGQRVDLVEGVGDPDVGAVDVAACFGAERLEDAPDLGPVTLGLLPAMGADDFREPDAWPDERVEAQGRQPDGVSEGDTGEAVLGYEVVGGGVLATTGWAVETEQESHESYMSLECQLLHRNPGVDGCGMIGTAPPTHPEDE